MLEGRSVDAASRAGRLGVSLTRDIARNRYADLLRAVAIGGVVYGHWLLVSVTYQRGQLSGVDAVDYVSWGRWLTWPFQVMPVFFLVGGYVNAQSWAVRHTEGQDWTRWVRDRALRLLWPTTVYVVTGVLAVLLAQAAGVPGPELAEAAWLAALHLWFLPVYLFLIVLTPAMHAAHARWGLMVPAVMAVSAALVSIGAHGLHLHHVGYANYLLVWGSIHQWGFAWHDRTLTTPLWRPYALAAGGAVLLAGLVTTNTFKVDLVGSGNTNPPSIALLAFAAAQSGLVLAAEPWAVGLLEGPRLWPAVERLNKVVMNIYLWHFAPVIVIATAFYPTGVLPQPSVGSAYWFELRLVWFGLLTAVLVPLIALVTWAERPMLRLPAGLGRRGPWSPILLTAGLAATSWALARLAINGFAPEGGTPWPTLTVGGLALVAILFTGRAPANSAPQQAGPAGARLQRREA
jgi:fucose 4-O-acetylase-like acetyltransferase